MNLAASRRRCASPPYSVSSGYGRDADQDAHGLLVTKIVAKVAAYTYGWLHQPDAWSSSRAH